jgi:hypothetical protein
MALQREVSPIPPGRYWIIVNGPSIADFDAWLRDMRGSVRVETVSLDSSKRGQASQFIIFRVPEGRFPFLNAVQFGFPSFAGPEITSVQDVVQLPVEKNPEDVAVDVIRKAGETAESLAGILPVLLLVLAASLFKR